jgi:pimeloyl-ACP methyl ester carboxylesterase
LATILREILQMKTKYTSEQTTSFGHIVQINDIEIYYEEYGAGKPLLLLHGFGGCSQNWHPFITSLSERYRLIVVDMRGHGYSTNPDNKFTHQDSAKDVFLLLDKLGIGTFSAMGMSSGGMTLLHMATSQPRRIHSIVLISATSYFPRQARQIMSRASFNTMPQQVREMYRACAKRGDEQIRQLIKQFNELSENYEDMNFTEQRLSTITARTFIIHGDCDNFFPVEIPESICRSIQDSELWIIPGGEHVPIYDTRIPFTSRALRFLDGLDCKLH